MQLYSAAALKTRLKRYDDAGPEGLWRPAILVAALGGLSDRTKRACPLASSRCATNQKREISTAGALSAEKAPRQSAPPLKSIG